MVEAPSLCEMLVIIHQSTWHHIADDVNLSAFCDGLYGTGLFISWRLKKNPLPKCGFH